MVTPFHLVSHTDSPALPHAAEPRTPSKNKKVEPASFVPLPFHDRVTKFDNLHTTARSIYVFMVQIGRVHSVYGITLVLVDFPPCVGEGH